ncbi:L-histidine N(alpha)-methyltransferase [Consotaella aegiceratis]|uniref:L-histidine N(alpha)-methyltransferase n=1 Tax=Consotaella aegiceratis TaxID=3097961 RepID=UPI002F3EB32C
MEMMVSKTKISDRLWFTNYSENLPFGYTAESIDHLIASLMSTSKYFPTEFSYDDAGSIYFDKFVDSEEYYLPKKEIEIFERYKDDLAELTGPCDIYEVGAGSSKKVKILLGAYNRLYTDVSFNPIDINGSIMIEGAKNYLKELENILVHCLVGAYSDVFSTKFTKNTRNLFLFIGSSISQEENDDLLKRIITQMNVNDFFLVAFDLQKDPEILKAAYQNYYGSMCSLHVLDHLNEAFDANFVTDNFEFEVIFNPEHGGCETHLRSKVEQIVTLEKLNLTVPFRAGESVRTGVQRKFRMDQMRERLESLGFREVRTFLDGQEWYAAMLVEAI